ncbi:MAG: hypothetical protein ABI402_13180 [Ferruginibacter sp.]
MIIKTSQFNALGEEMFKQFLNDLTVEMIAKYPNWMGNENYSQKCAVVKSLAEYGQGINITETDSLSKFVNHLICFNQNIPLNFGIVNELKNVNVDEEIRIERLFFHLASDREKLILIEI